MKDILEKDIQNNIPLIARKDYERHIKIKDITLSDKKISIIAGPCTVESRSQIMDIAKNIKNCGATMLRGGIFKPLTFPYGEPLARPDAGSGLPEPDRLKILSKKELYDNAKRRLSFLKEAGEKYGLPVVSEILYADSISMMQEFVDVFQVGYRHMFNMDLIEALSKSNKPILIKRHYGESLRSLLGVGEHFEARGKHDIMFCERGVAVAHTHNIDSRAIIDIQAIPALKEYAPTVPVFVDPSHATFRRGYVAPVSRAAIAAGADGLLVEVHGQPEKAWVDPLQSLDFKSFEKLMRELNAIAKILGRSL
ncbi:MAG: 3-deoxy-7-phosphoheptulonate synthase [Candidatus Omnitrophica bacterium]|nr:3-deoxy-7-phosphoheptulonate synthase [Candidatus Omnitrophota bacterium]MDD5237446.1 3-deoxy-7-phosphoheptulonate synthase [Candidatus Omnitrophota bacterium]